MKAAATAALVAVIALSGCGGGQESAPASRSTPVSSAPAKARASATAAPSTPDKAAAELAYVLEVTGKAPAMALARDELVQAGHATCEAFRTKPGGISVLMRNAKKAGQTEAQLKDLRIITTAAIRNLCPDQAGDLTS